MRFYRSVFIWWCMILGGMNALGEATFPEVTHVAQLPKLAGLNRPEHSRIRFEGEVLWADCDAGKIALKDASGMALLDLDLRGQPVSAGWRVRVTGNGTIARVGQGYQLGVNGPVVDDDGAHSMLEKTGALYLTAGRHPMWLDWFNRIDEFGLEVEYSGPGIPRQKIPDDVLFRSEFANTNALNPGLNYECFAVTDMLLPKAEQRAILKSGGTENFNIGVCPRPDQVGLRFSGWLEVPRDGLYTFYLRSDDGSQMFIDAPSLRVELLDKAPAITPRQLTVGQLVNEECQWAQIAGTVAFVSKAGRQAEMEIRSGDGRMAVRITDAAGLPGDLLGQRVRATGVCVSTFGTDGHKIAGKLLVSDAKQIEMMESNRRLAQSTNGLPLLTTVVEVHQLKREEALRHYPVNIRGVVTCVQRDVGAVTIQDATRGLYAVDLSAGRSRLPEVGAFVEIKGATDAGFFAPVVNATELTELGAGHLPEPVRPTWDQLINGSLDAQYVELQGIITAVNTNGVTLLTREGRIKLELRVPGVEHSELPRYENALVRVRGCLFANWDYVTHQVKAGEVRLYGAMISMDQPAPDDLFAAQKKTFEELLLFDPQAGAFQRVKVMGLVLHAHDTECYLTDGKSGLRVVASKPIQLSAGDLVEVVGFPDLGGASPTLREAVTRIIRNVPLPPPTVLAPEGLLDGKHDATRVQVRGALAGVRSGRSEQLLEIQSGSRPFIARLPGGQDLNGSLPVGCLVELTGVYSGLGGNKAIGQEITSFELLLNGPSDLKVLARPPWWTLERLLVAVGALVCVLVAALIWIKQLHRQVDERTHQLEKQIHARERVEQQRALEHERARVAQDLHDDLGAGLTEISVLGQQARSRLATEEQRAQFLDQLDDRARYMVGALDEIVWAMSPAQDSIESLVSYFCLHADRFLGAANIAWQLENPADLPDVPINSLCRHELFLAFKEALTNLVRHSGATEVRLGIRLENGRLILTVADNGCGISSDTRDRNSDGLANMRARMEKLKGGFEIASKPGHGTTLRFSVPAGN